MVLLNLTEVYKKISDANIKLFSYDIPEIKAASIEIDKKYGIFINHKQIDNSDEEFMVTTHEYGHCKSGATHKLNSKYDLICKHEYKANRQAVLEFLPIELIKKALNSGCIHTHEFAEYLDMPEEFVRLAFKHYKAMDLI